MKCLSMEVYSSLNQYLRVRPGAYNTNKYLKDAPLGQAPGLLTNIRLGLKEFPRPITRLFGFRI
jgi:hypothetical protein